MRSVDNFFFFQAEDGIRDDLVTGVQTCALPISIFWRMWKMDSDQKSIPVVGFLTRNDCDVLRAKTDVYRRVTNRTIILPSMVWIGIFLLPTPLKPLSQFSLGFQAFIPQIKKHLLAAIPPLSRAGIGY